MFFFLIPVMPHIEGEFIQFMLAELIKYRLLFFLISMVLVKVDLRNS